MKIIKLLQDLVEGIVAIIVLPFILLFTLLIASLPFLLIASPFILIGFIVWAVAR